MTARPRVIVVDDKLAMAETLADGLGDHGFAATALASGRAAIEAVRAGRADAVVTDLRMPDVDGLAVLDVAREHVPVIVMTAYGAIDSAVESIRKGAYHYLTKPFKLEELVVFLRRALDERALRREAQVLRRALGQHYALAGVVGESPAMQHVLALVHKLGPSDVPILIAGETGTGKTMIARALHGASRRADRPFVPVNCAALPEQLLESELFGHVKGAFTGATSDHAGLFAAADGGTLLLDEIAELPLALQAKLLRVIEAGTLRPVGATAERRVDVRVIAATHRDLHAAAAAGTFRADLLYRLDVVAIELPPLRVRAGDLPALVEHFLAEARRRHPHARATALGPGAMRRVLAYAWPGNVRQLAHALERGVLLANDDAIAEADLELPDVGEATEGGLVATFVGEVIAMDALQRRYARWALERCGGHKTRTAELLDIDVKTLNRYLRDGD